MHPGNNTYAVVIGASVEHLATNRFWRLKNGLPDQLDRGRHVLLQLLENQLGLFGNLLEGFFAI